MVDPAIVARLVGRQRPASPILRLAEREHEVLGLLAQGRSNAGIADQLGISEPTGEAACAQVFRELDLEQSHDQNRRVLAVLTWLRS